MKRIILTTIFVFLMCSISSAQSPIPELEKAKQIKPLETSREEVRKIFADYNLEKNDSEYYDKFSTNNFDIYISYSSGICPEDLEETSEWNVPKWKATNIEIRLKHAIKIQDIGIDLSKYRKERMFSNLPNSYMYHSKDLGIALEVDESVTKEITIIPPREYYSLFCDSEAGKKHALRKSWFLGSIKDRVVAIDRNDRPKVVNLILSTDEIIIKENTKIAVLVSAIDPENDTLSYYYEISGGKIIGSGREISSGKIIGGNKSVVWDLSGEKAGTYTITVGADDGVGIDGNTMTKTITVKDCSDCQ